MIVERGCARCRVVSATDHEDGWLTEYLTFEKANAYWARRAGGSGTIAVYNQVARAFPSGLLARVLADAPADGVRVEVVDRRVRPCDPRPVAEWPRPGLVAGARDYQVEAARAAIRGNPGIVWLPTGSGKTRVFAMVVSALPCTWLLVVPQIHLLDQAAAELEREVGEPVGRCGDSEWSTGRVTVSTYQTLHAGVVSGSARVLELLGSVQGVGVDEVHMAAADSIAQVLLRAERAYWRVGLSATPLARGDRKSTMVVACVGPVAYRARTRDLVRAGHLAQTTVRMVPVCHQPAQRQETPAAAYLRDVVLCEPRNAAVEEIVRLAAKPCVVFVSQVRHGRALAKRLARAGHSQEFIWSSASRQQRQDAVARLARGATDVVIASPVFDQGVDIPCLASGVNAGAGASVIRALQRLGRGSRTDGGRKTEFEFWDILDLGHRRLTPQARARQRTYIREGHAVVERDLALPESRKDVA